MHIEYSEQIMLRDYNAANEIFNFRPESPYVIRAFEPGEGEPNIILPYGAERPVGWPAEVNVEA